MTPHSVFLRLKCILPVPLDPVTEPVGENWMRVEEITAPVFDTMIRQRGWHFMLVDQLCARNAFGFTERAAVQGALARSLKGVETRFNAAELISIRVRRCPGFYIAGVTLQPRQVQQYTWLEIAGDWHQLAVPVR